MHIGIDFDNTIVNYEGVFHRVAVKQGLISPTLSTSKNAVRDYLRKQGREDAWTELQGLVYGPYMNEASLYPGVIEFFRQCRQRNLPVSIISHRTRFPYLGEKHDLHRAARIWLASQHFHPRDPSSIDPAEIGLPANRVFFELTKDEKLARIVQAGCTHFIDDLPEFLGLPGFPPNMQKILFDPENGWPDGPLNKRVRSWREIQGIFGSLTPPAESI